MFEEEFLKGQSYWCLDRRHSDCRYDGKRGSDIGCSCKCHSCDINSWCVLAKGHSSICSNVPLDYEISLPDRIKELLGEFDKGGNKTEFTYSWDHGYEEYSIQNDGEGRLTYRGAYHPRTVCETGWPDPQGVCIWCGSTML